MFVVLPTYTAPLSEVDRHLDAHRAWLDAQYAAGRFLVAGRREPRDGGFILAADGDRAELDRVIAADPFATAGVAEYQVLEVHPTGGRPDFLAALEAHGVAVAAPR
jgi:uncharacterized protein YciI